MPGPTTPVNVAELEVTLVAAFVVAVGGLLLP